MPQFEAISDMASKYWERHGSVKSQVQVEMEEKPRIKKKMGHESSVKWTKAIHNFCRNTTLHGMNRVVEESPFTGRK